MQATRGARNRNLKIVTTHASHECNQYLFGLPQRMNGMHRTQFDHARLDLLAIRNLITLVLPICHVKVMQSPARPHSVTFGYY